MSGEHEYECPHHGVWSWSDGKACFRDEPADVVLEDSFTMVTTIGEDVHVDTFLPKRTGNPGSRSGGT